MIFNEYAAEKLMIERQREIDRSAREAWKWSGDKPKPPAQWLNRLNVFRLKPAPCCAASCC